MYKNNQLSRNFTFLDLLVSVYYIYGAIDIIALYILFLDKSIL